MKVLVLALDGVFDLGLSCMLDALGTANELAALQSPEAPPPLELELVGLRRQVRTAQGLQVPVQALRGDEQPDWILLPALGTKLPQTLLPALERREVREACTWLRERHSEDGARIAAACIAGFVLAESGLLDGYAATTTWWLGPLFRQRYPQVALDESRLVLESGPFVTSGAAMGHLDLSLWLLRQVSPALAATVARYLIVDERPSQAPYIIPDHLAHADPLVARFEAWVRAHLAEGFSLDAAATALAVSPRTLQRRCEAVLGKSPLAFVQDLRVQQAAHLLRSTRLDVEQVAAQVGYADGVSLRALLRRKLGRGVRELRGN